MKTTCLVCKVTKKLPTKKDNELWWDQPQALLETYHYSLKNKQNNTNFQKSNSNIDSSAEKKFEK